MAATAMIYMTITIMLQSISGAPLISKNNTQDTNDARIGKIVTQKFSLLEDGLFEGDIETTEDFIRQHYNFSSIPGGEKYMTHEDENNVTTVSGEEISKRGAVRSNHRLWPNGIVPYQFSSSIQTNLRHSIRDAMNHWEDRTCLRFTVRNGEGDYVEYNNKRRRCSSYVGRIGGNQTVNVFSDSTARCSFGTIVHEIGHAIGFWHEQSRPDRDNYVGINLTNVDRTWHRNFMKRWNIDSRGSEYDYGSVMHYSTTAFVRRRNCRGCHSIEVTNTTAYHAQGSPRIGQRTGLSIKDAEQANHLYSCPRRGVTGVLVVHVKNGQSLPYNNTVPDLYIKITAVDSSGSHHVCTTSVKQGTTSPTWNEDLEVPEREWQFFRIQVWDNSTSPDGKMSTSETIVIKQGEHNDIKHCLDDVCNGHVLYDYTMLTTATLIVNVRNAKNLQDTDPTDNIPDPYVIVEATSSTGSHSKQTACKRGTVNPTWNTVLNFGCRRWVPFIELQVWDADELRNGDDNISTKQKIQLLPGNHSNNSHKAYGRGYMIFDYDFVLKNECSSNPCQNGGTCINGCAGYTCYCRHPFSGTNCEHLSGNLRVYARYGRNLPDYDGLDNNSDPYLEVIAYDANGNSVRKISSYKGGDLSPDWNEWLDFGTREWKQFKVTVYDTDSPRNADDPLSNQHTWNLSSYASHNGVRLDCYSGYVVFDYHFD